MSFRSHAIRTGLPLLFVFLWSTGFISAKFGLPSAEPFTFLGIRMLLATLLLFSLVPFFDVTWPKRMVDYGHMAVVAILIHCVYLGGVFSAIKVGLPSSMTAIVIGLQPLVTVFLATRWLGESITRIKIAGLILGFIGVTIVIGQQDIDTGAINYPGLVFSAVALIAICAGTVYQKKFCGGYDLLPSVCFQFLINTVVMGILAFSLESRDVDWTLSFVLALGWLVLVLSVGTSMLLLWLIRTGEAGKVAGLFYLVPPFVVVQAWILFDETFGLISIMGIVACVIGVGMVLKSGNKSLVKIS